MNKLSLDALKMRAEAVASEELMIAISGGTQEACHNKTLTTPPPPHKPKGTDNTGVSYPGGMYFKEAK